MNNPHPPESLLPWLPMESSPKDGTRVLLKFKDNLAQFDRSESGRLDSFSGLEFVGRHHGYGRHGDFDMGWSFAAPVGHGGFIDGWMVGWIPLPTTTLISEPTDKPDAGFEEWAARNLCKPDNAASAWEKFAASEAWQARQPEIDKLKSSLTIRTACYESANHRADALAAEIDRLKADVRGLREALEEIASGRYHKAPDNGCCEHKTYSWNACEACVDAVCNKALATYGNEKEEK